MCRSVGGEWGGGGEWREEGVSGGGPAIQFFMLKGWIHGAEW